MYFPIHFRNLLVEGEWSSALKLRAAYQKRIGPFPLRLRMRSIREPFSWAWTSVTDSSYKRMFLILEGLIRPSLMSALGSLAEPSPSTALRDVLSAQMRSTAAPTLLRYADRNAAAIGIENRMPFLDHRLVELALRVPERYLFDGARTKFILRAAMKPLMPPEIFDRVDKIGFQADMDLTRAFALTMGDRFLENATPLEAEWFNPDALRAFLAAAPQPNDDFLLWRIVNTKHWLRRFAC